MTKRRVIIVFLYCCAAAIALVLARFGNGRIALRMSARHDLPALLLLAAASYTAIWCGASRVRFVVRLSTFLIATIVLLVAGHWMLGVFAYAYYREVGMIHGIVSALTCLAIEEGTSRNWRATFGRLWMRDFFVFAAAVGGTLWVCDWIGMTIVFDHRHWDRVLMLRGVSYALVPIAVYCAHRFTRHTIARLVISMSAAALTGFVAANASVLLEPNGMSLRIMLAGHDLGQSVWYIGIACSQTFLLFALLTLIWSPARNTEADAKSLATVEELGD